MSIFFYNPWLRDMRGIDVGLDGERETICVAFVTPNVNTIFGVH